MKNSQNEDKNYYVKRQNPPKDSIEYKNFYKGADVVDYQEILGLGFPTFYNKKRPSYKHKGTQNWEKVDIPHYLQGVEPTGKFFKTGEKALPTGENIAVIDLDVENGKNVGLEALSTWLQENNVDIKEANTFQVKTASGGIHFYYTYPDGVKIKSNASVFLPHVDVRASGGIIMLPGSKAEKDGKVGEYKIAGKSVSYIKPLPEKILQAICEKPKEVKAKERKARIPSKGSTYLEKVKNSILEEIANAQEGERNHKLYAQSCKAGGYGLPYEEMLEEILDVTTLEKDEVEKTFDFGYNWGLEHPIEIPEMKMKNKKEGKKMEEKIEGLPTLTELKKYWIKNSSSIDIKYITEEGNFIVYREEKGVWERIYQNQAMKELVKIQERLLDLYEENTNEDRDYSRHESFIARTSWVEDGLKTIKAKNEITKAELDSRPELLVVKNGTLNLKTGELKGFNKQGLHTKRSPHTYKTNEELKNIPQDKKEKFKKILEVLDVDTLKYLQIAFGQSITGMQTDSSKTFWLYSKGQSGKSTIINLLQEVSGEWAETQAGGLLNVDSSRFSASSLSGTRVAVVEEAPVGYLEAGKMKALAGTEYASLEQKGKSAYTEAVTWTFIIATNALPKIRKSEANWGTFRRIAIIPFLKTFNKENPESDSSLLRAYKDPEICELFLNWLVEGSMKWFENPELEEDYSFEMIKIMDKWQKQESEESNPVGSFLSLALEKDEQACVELDELFEYFLKHSESENNRSKLSKLKFKKEVENTLDVEIVSDRRSGSFRYSTFKTVDTSNKKAKLFHFSFKNQFKYDHPQVVTQWNPTY